jgi:hypothetical protein
MIVKPWGEWRYVKGLIRDRAAPLWEARSARRLVHASRLLDCCPYDGRATVNLQPRLVMHRRAERASHNGAARLRKIFFNSDFPTLILTPFQARAEWR